MKGSVIGVVLGCIFANSAQAEILWDTTEIDARASYGQQVVQAAFPFRVENEPVTILSIKTSCGCTTTKLEKKVYAPGDTGVIEATFNLGSRVGQQEKHVYLQLDDPDQPSEDLTIRVYIPHVLKIEPRFVYWNKRVQPYHEQFIDLKVDSELDLSIVSISSDQDQLKIHWEAMPAQDHMFRVYLKPEVPAGELPFFRAVIKIEVDATAKLKQKFYYAYAFMKSS